MLLLVVVLGACQLRSEIAIDVDGNGSGTVSVGVGLDDDAIGRLPDLDGDGRSTGADLRRLTRTRDLEATGWTITGPAEEDEGITWMRASKPFGNAAEAGRVLDEVTGPGGPFRDFEVSLDHSFVRTDYDFRGTVDFTGGLASLGDDALTAELDGEPLGEDVEALERRIGTTVDRFVRMRVVVRLPGAVESNAPTQADNGAVWQPRIGGPAVELRASSEVRHVSTLVWGGIAAVTAFALVLLVVVRLARWRRGKAAA